MDKKSARGGARPGAGRPRGDGRVYSFRASGRVADALDSRECRTDFILKSLEDALNAEETVSERPGTGWHMPASEEASRTEGDCPPYAAAATGLTPLSLPFYDVRVVAGFPVPFDSDERSQETDVLRLLCPHPEASYLIRVSGDSMIDAGVENGDIVIVDKSIRNPSPGEIAVCELNGEFTLKHFVIEGGKGWLVPANQAYPRIAVTEEDDFSIWGTVTYIIHKARV